MLNNVSLNGRLTRDPEVRTAGETKICNFTIAIDRPGKKGEERQADFPRITVFGKQAENCGKYLKKGSLVGVQGRIQTGSYQNKDGNTVYTTDVVATNVYFLSSPNANNTNVPAPAPTTEPQDDFAEYEAAELADDDVEF